LIVDSDSSCQDESNHTLFFELGPFLHKINIILEIPLLIKSEVKIAVEAELVKVGLSRVQIDLARKIRKGSTNLISFHHLITIHQMISKSDHPSKEASSVKYFKLGVSYEPVGQIFIYLNRTFWVLLSQSFPVFVIEMVSFD